MINVIVFVIFLSIFLYLIGRAWKIVDSRIKGYCQHWRDVVIAQCMYTKKYFRRRLQFLNKFKIVENSLGYRLQFLDQFLEKHGKSFLKWLVVMSIPFVFFLQIYDSRDVAEKLIGFDEYRKDYYLKRLEISTKGDVIVVEKLADRYYRKVQLSNGDVIIEGVFRYEIRPQGKFIPKVNHSDRWGRNPENNEYWQDYRQGIITFGLKQK